MPNITQTQAPMIIDIQYKIADVSARLILAEQELAKTEQALKVQELRTTLQAYKQQEEKIREELKQSMITSGIKSVETDTHKFTIKTNPGSISIVDEQMIPKEYKKEKITITIDKTAIKEAIKRGEDVYGATMTTTKTLLITSK